MFGAFVSSNVDDRYDAAEPAVLEALLPQYRTALTDIRLWHVDIAVYLNQWKLCKNSGISQQIRRFS